MPDSNCCEQKCVLVTAFILVLLAPTDALSATCPVQHQQQEQNGLQIKADHIRRSDSQGYEISGSVELLHPDYTLYTQKLTADSALTSYRSPFDFYLNSSAVRIWGEGFEYQEEREEAMATIKGLTVTTCPGERENLEWWLESSLSTYDPEEQDLVSHHTVLWFKGVPILYLPWVSLSAQRRSGLLAPAAGVYQASIPGSDRSFDHENYYHQGVYLNLAPNYDATFYVTALQGRGVLRSGEFRYLTRRHRGNFSFSVLPSDPLLNSQPAAGKDLSSLAWSHDARLSRNLRFDANFVGYSPRYLHRTLPNEAADKGAIGSNSRNRWARFQYLSQPSRTEISYIDTYSLIDSDRDGFRRIPQLRHWQYLDREGSSRLTLYGSLNKFVRAGNTLTAPQAVRVTLEPRWNLQAFSSYYHLAARNGIRYNHYALEEPNASGQKQLNFASYYSSAGGRIYIDNSFSDDINLTLVPALYYVYVPTVKQDALPNYDVSEKNISRIEQLHDPKEVNGEDGLRPSNRFVASLAQRIYLPSSQLHGTAKLGRNFDVEKPSTPRASEISYSAWFAELTANHEPFYADLLTQWQENADKIHTINSNVFFTAQRYSLRTNYLYQSTNTVELQYVSAGISLQLNDNWYVGSAIGYNIGSDLLNSVSTGVSYDDCCWQFSLLVDNSLTRNPATNLEARRFNLSLELRLKPLGSLGGSQIPQRIDERAQGFVVP